MTQDGPQPNDSLEVKLWRQRYVDWVRRSTQAQLRHQPFDEDEPLRPGSGLHLRLLGDEDLR